MYRCDRLDAAGQMPGQGTQTGIQKGTNVEQTLRYFGGLRGPTKTKLSVVTLKLDPIVSDGSNPSLTAAVQRSNALAKHMHSK